MCSAILDRLHILAGKFYPLSVIGILAKYHIGATLLAMEYFIYYTEGKIKKA